MSLILIKQKGHFLVSLNFSKIIINYFIKLLPVISFGCGRSITLRIVGAMSQRLPLSSLMSLTLLPTIMNGTRFVVWAVNGWLVVSSNIFSALPWSAVMNMMPSFSFTFWTISPTHLSTASFLLLFGRFHQHICQLLRKL